MGFMDGFRQGRDAAVAAREEEVRARREECRVHGRRYPGCPLDMIEIEALGRIALAPPRRPGKRVRHE